jgi:creatinine amidohydrolase
MEIVACTDLAAVTATLHAAARAAGIDAGAAGHHAGEIETSILLAIRPGDVRLHALAPGRIEPAADAQHLFYPDLRAHAPTGTVGDPRAADAARGLVYLDAWARLLVAALAAAPTGAAKNRHQANGTKNP